MKEYFLVLEEIRPVKGYLRGALYDLPRGEFRFVSNDLIDFIQNKNRSSITNMSKEELDIVNYLVENEYAILVSEKVSKMFPKLSTQWDYPSLISNVVIEIESVQKELNSILQKLSIFGVTVAKFEIHSVFSQTDLNLFSEILNRSKIRLVTLILHNSAVEFEKMSISSKIESIIVLNSVVEFTGSSLSSNLIIKTPQNRDAFISNQRKKPYSFNVNIKLFTESLKFNPYFNRKLYIGLEGQIKNAFECDEIFGYINSVTSTELKEIVHTNEFQKYWRVCPDMIDIAKDSEFRYMDIDTRVPLQRKDGSWYYREPSDYNPYIGKWKDKNDFRDFAECGVICNQEEFSLDHEKIAKTNIELWGEN